MPYPHKLYRLYYGVYNYEALKVRGRRGQAKYGSRWLQREAGFGVCTEWAGGLADTGDGWPAAASPCGAGAEIPWGPQPTTTAAAGEDRTLEI